MLTLTMCGYRKNANCYTLFQKSIGTSTISSLAIIQNRSNQKMYGQSFLINILVALQPLEYSFNKNMFLNIETTANKFPGKLFIRYKLHPNQDSKAYNNLLRSSI